MVSAINNSNAMHHTGVQKNVKTPVASSEESGDAKPHGPPGQAAKAAIAASQRTDLPANIQGKVASALARGLDVTSLLTLQEITSPDEVAATTEDETVTEDIDLAAGEETDSTANIAQPDDTPSEVISIVDNDAAMAAELLEETEQETDNTTP